MSTASWEEIAIGLADMARRLLAEPGVDATLSAIVAHAVQLVDGCDAAGIMSVRRGSVQTLAVTDNVARASDRLQGELGEGPCFDATRNREQIYRIHDLSTSEERWPRFVPQARQLGVGSMMGFLLYTNGHDNLGALDLFSARPGVFTERSERVGWVLASHASVALANSRHAENMDKALDSSRAIGEAIGIVMSRYRETEEQALDRLVHVSQTTNIKLRDLAQEIIRIGEIPSTAADD